MSTDKAARIVSAVTRRVVHTPECPAGAGHTIIRSADADPFAVKHHCISAGFAGTNVVEVAERIAEHAYRWSFIWPDNLDSPLCLICRQPEAAH